MAEASVCLDGFLGINADLVVFRDGKTRQICDGIADNPTASVGEMSLPFSPAHGLVYGRMAGLSRRYGRLDRSRDGRAKPCLKVKKSSIKNNLLSGVIKVKVM